MRFVLRSIWEIKMDTKVRTYQHHRVLGISKSEAEKLAANFTPPPWATHIAVRSDGSRCEAACWRDQEQEYLDEDPSLLNAGQWAGAFRQAYWSFVPVPLKSIC